MLILKLSLPVPSLFVAVDEIIEQICNLNITVNF